MVLHEEQQSNSGSNSRSKSKKAKKIPQRGLGVAQLEKLRIEEQQKHNTSASNSSSSSNPFSNIILPPTPPKQPPLPFMSPTDQYPIPSVYKMDLSHPTASFPFYGTSLPQNTAIDPIEMNTQINHLQSRNQYDQQKSTVTLVNKTMLPLPSGVNLQNEPPSNQIYSNQIYSSYMRPSWTEEVKTASTNPSWPITMPDFTSFPRRNLPVLNSFRTPDEHANEAMKFESRSTGFREDGSSSITHQVDWRNSDIHVNKRLRESNLLMDSSFLSLGSSLVQSISKSNPKHCEHPEIALLQSHLGGANREFLQCEEALQQPFYNFFPLAPSITCEAAPKDEGNIGLDGVDTSLKL